MDVMYEIGHPEKDGTLALYGFSIPNLHTNDEHEVTEVNFRWAEKVAAVRAPSSPLPCRGMTFKVSSPKPQRVTVEVLSDDERIRLGEIAISGEKAWEERSLRFTRTFAPDDRIELTAEKEYLGMWRQNGYRLSDLTFHFDGDVSIDVGMEAFRTSQRRAYTLLFGDPHVHTNGSLCSRTESFGTLQENVDKALDAGHDFIGFTDHPEHFLHFEEAWDRYVEMYQRYSSSPFIVLPGYEWASKSYGNYNVYFDGIPPLDCVVHSWEQRANSLKKLWAVCERSGRGFLTIPHHTYHPTLPLYVSCPVPEQYQSAVEIFSFWGSSERYDPQPAATRTPRPNNTFSPGFYIEDMLRRGMKLGIVGGTDAHPFFAGDAAITGVYAQEFSLNGIFEAIRARRTYAATDRIKLGVYANGYPMGHVFRVNQFSVNVVFPLRFVVDVEATSSILKVELIANGYTIREASYSDGEVVKHIEWEVPRGTQELADTDRYYYVKVTQEKGPKVYPQRGYAWSSPIWVDYEYVDNPTGECEEGDRVFMDMEDCRMVPFAPGPPRPTRRKRRSIMDL